VCGSILLERDGDRADLAAVARYFKVDADRRNADSQIGFAIVPLQMEDFGKAVRYLKIASEKRHPMAFYYLAPVYARGIGVPMDGDAARRFLQVSARAGFPPAEAILTGPLDRAWIYGSFSL
jgi:TPR repeat protein